MLIARTAVVHHEGEGHVKLAGDVDIRRPRSEKAGWTRAVFAGVNGFWKWRMDWF